jgi:hypothetical protein
MHPQLPPTHSLPGHRQIDLFSASDEAWTQAAEAQLRRALTHVFLSEEPVPVLLRMTSAVPSPGRPAWRLVAHTLLARRLEPAARRQAKSRQELLESCWEQPDLRQRWQRLMSVLTGAQRCALVRQAQRLGLVH